MVHVIIYYTMQPLYIPMSTHAPKISPTSHADSDKTPLLNNIFGYYINWQLLHHPLGTERTIRAAVIICPPSKAPRIYMVIKMRVRVGIGLGLGRCLSQRAGSGSIPTRYGIFITDNVYYISHECHTMVV